MPIGDIPKEIHHITNREDWLQWRIQDITASDVGALFRAPPNFKSALQVYLDKTEGPSHIADNEAMRWGRWLEPAAIEALSELKPEWRVKRSGKYIRMPSIRLGSTPDLENQQIEPIEVKAPFGDGLKKWDGEPPLGYQLQTLVQMMTMDAPRGWILGLEISSYRARAELYPIERNPAAETRIIEAVAEFWKRVASNTPPPIDPEIDAGTVLRAYPEDNGAEIDLLSDNRMPELLSNLVKWTAEKKDLDARIKAAETEIKGKLGDAEYGLVNGFDVSWKTQHRKGYQVQPSTIRVLRVKNLRPNSERAA